MGWIVTLILGALGLILAYFEHLDDEEREQEERMYNACLDRDGMWMKNDRIEKILEADTSGRFRIIIKGDHGYSCLFDATEGDEEEEEE